jgi:ABC-type branched-subunit amino acid transport system permease subunit
MVVGGAGTLSGPIIGGLVYVWLDNTTRGIGTDSSGVLGFIFGWTDQSPATLILGLALIVIMLFAPIGLVGLLRKLTRRIVTIIPSLSSRRTVRVVLRRPAR